MRQKPNILSVLRSMVLGVTILTLAACGPAKPTATAVPSPSPLPPTQTATPLPTATITPIPTATSTPVPTATPQGFYIHNEAGFSLELPSSWEVSDEQMDGMVAIEQSAGLTLFFISEAEAKAQNEEDLRVTFKDDKVGIGKNAKPEDILIEEITLADTVKGLMLTSEQKIEDLDLKVKMTYVHSGGRAYYIYFIGKPKNIDSRELTMERILNSIDFFRPQPEGLDRDKTIYLLSGDPDPEDLDPATATGSAATMVGMFYSGLVRFSPNMQIMPDLAESWTTSSDGKVYTFTLREGMEFSSGAPITATEVKKSWERATLQFRESLLVSTYLGDIAGVQEKLDGRANFISGVKVIDERTLEVTLVGARPYFLAKLTYPTAAVVNHGAVDIGENWMYSPDSSGPYIMHKYMPGYATILKRNPNYHTQGSIEYLYFFASAGGAPISLYEEGTIDILPLSVENVQRVSQPEDELHDQMVSAPSMCTSMLIFNTRQAPMDDPMVRKALIMATDKEALNTSWSNDFNEVAESILPPAMPARLEREPVYPFDVEAAREMLKNSSYAGKPLTITLTVGGYSDSPNEELNVLVEMWRKNLDIQVKIQYVDPANITQALKNNPGSIISYGWCADYPDPQNFLDILFHSESEFNVAGIENAELDQILVAARSENDSQKRMELYQQAETLVLTEPLAIPLNHGVSYSIVNPRVKNFTLTPFGILIYPWLTLEPETQP